MVSRHIFRLIIDGLKFKQIKKNLNIEALGKRMKKLFFVRETDYKPFNSKILQKDKFETIHWCREKW